MSFVLIIGYNILQTYSEGLKPDILNSNFIHYPLQKFQKYDKPSLVIAGAFICLKDLKELSIRGQYSK